MIIASGLFSAGYFKILVRVADYTKKYTYIEMVDELYGRCAKRVYEISTFF